MLYHFYHVSIYSECITSGQFTIIFYNTVVLYKNKGLKYNKSRALIKFSSKQRSWVEAKL
ncbi:hypothetical protein AC572_13105 [Mannheimia haemolytica]|nr:hypothetical protein AC572_13105 [Mannheimia haemolytica]